MAETVYKKLLEETPNLVARKNQQGSLKHLHVNKAATLRSNQSGTTNSNQRVESSFLAFANYDAATFQNIIYSKTKVNKLIPPQKSASTAFQVNEIEQQLHSPRVCCPRLAAQLRCNQPVLTWTRQRLVPSVSEGTRVALCHGRKPDTECCWYSSPSHTR